MPSPQERSAAAKRRFELDPDRYSQEQKEHWVTIRGTHVKVEGDEKVDFNDLAGHDEPHIAKAKSAAHAAIQGLSHADMQAVIAHLKQHADDQKSLESEQKKASKEPAEPLDEAKIGKHVAEWKKLYESATDPNVSYQMIHDHVAALGKNSSRQELHEIAKQVGVHSKPSDSKKEILKWLEDYPRRNKQSFNMHSH